MALLAITLLACSKKPSTPTEAFKAFYEAAKNKDVASLKKLMAQRSLTQREESAKRNGKSLDEFLASESQKDIPPSIPETRNEKIEGDNASVEFRSGNSENWRTVRLVKESDEWKVIF